MCLSTSCVLREGHSISQASLGKQCKCQSGSPSSRVLITFCAESGNNVGQAARKKVPQILPENVLIFQCDAHQGLPGGGLCPPAGTAFEADPQRPQELPVMSTFLRAASAVFQGRGSLRRATPALDFSPLGNRPRAPGRPGDGLPALCGPGLLARGAPGCPPLRALPPPRSAKRE